MPLFVPKDRKSLFRQFLAGMYDAVVITDPNGHILEINPRAEEHFGYVRRNMFSQAKRLSQAPEEKEYHAMFQYYKQTE